MANTFPRCVAFTLQEEGGFVDNKTDPGGATNYGITKRTLESYLGHAVSVDDVINMPKTTAEAIYKAKYWDKMNCASLPAGVDLLVFDFGVNSGPDTSVEILQQVLDVPDDDKIGPITLLAIKGMRAPNLIAELTQAHIEHYRSLSGFLVFGKGWIARTERAEAEATAMNAQANGAAPPAPRPIIQVPQPTADDLMAQEQEELDEG